MRKTLVLLFIFTLTVLVIKANGIPYAYPSKEISLVVKPNPIDSTLKTEELLNNILHNARYLHVTIQLDSAKKLYKYAYQIAEKNKNTLTLIACEYYLAKIEGALNNHKESLKLLMSANNRSISSRNYKYHHYIQLGLVELFRKEENYGGAFNLLEQLKGNIFNPPIDTFALVEYYNRYAAVYNETKNTGKAAIDSAITYSYLALRLSLIINSQSRIALSYNELGFSYENLFDYKKAEEYYNRAAKIYKETQSDRNYLNTINNLARIYTKQNRPNESIKLIESILPELDKYNWNQMAAYLYKQKAESHEMLRQYDSAVFCYKKSFEYEKKQINETSEFDIKLDKIILEKTELANHIEKLEKTISRQKLRYRITIAVAIAFLILSMALIRYLLFVKNKLKDLEEHRNEESDTILVLENSIQDKEKEISELKEKLEVIRRMIE
jgi:tetratricopeptide (TPR) repeat protein